MRNFPLNPLDRFIGPKALIMELDQFFFEEAHVPTVIANKRSPLAKHYPTIVLQAALEKLRNILESPNSWNRKIRQTHIKNLHGLFCFIPYSFWPPACFCLLLLSPVCLKTGSVYLMILPFTLERFGSWCKGGIFFCITKRSIIMGYWKDWRRSHFLNSWGSIRFHTNYLP